MTFLAQRRIIPCIKCCHFVESLYIKECNISVKGIRSYFNETYSCAKLYKGARHFFERNIVISRDLQLRKVLFKRYRGSWKEDRLTTKWIPLSNNFNRLWYSLKQGGCKYVQSLLQKGVKHSIPKACIDTKKTRYFEIEPLGVVFFGIYMSWLYACSTPFHTSETPEQNRRHQFEETKSFL